MSIVRGRSKFHCILARSDHTHLHYLPSSNTTNTRPTRHRYSGVEGSWRTLVVKAKAQRKKVVSYLQCTFLVRGLAFPFPHQAQQKLLLEAQTWYLNWSGICMLFSNCGYSDIPGHLDLFIPLDSKPFKTVQLDWRGPRSKDIVKHTYRLHTDYMVVHAHVISTYACHWHRGANLPANPPGSAVKRSYQIYDIHFPFEYIETDQSISFFWSSNSDLTDPVVFQ